MNNFGINLGVRVPLLLKIVPDITEFVKNLLTFFDAKYLDFKYFTEFLKIYFKKNPTENQTIKTNQQTVPNPETWNSWLRSIICIKKLYLNILTQDIMCYILKGRKKVDNRKTLLIYSYCLN